MFRGNETISGFDDELAKAMNAENLRQEERPLRVQGVHFLPAVTTHADRYTPTDRYTRPVRSVGLWRRRGAARGGGG